MAAYRASSIPFAGFEFRFEIYAFPLEVSFVWLTPSRPEAGRKLRITR